VSDDRYGPFGTVKGRSQPSSAFPPTRSAEIRYDAGVHRPPLGLTATSFPLSRFILVGIILIRNFVIVIRCDNFIALQRHLSPCEMPFLFEREPEGM
jgi:hypothetical protein